MSGSFISTKLLIPPLAKSLVVRPQLDRKLLESLRPGTRLVLVSAPAGFGKTTLVTGWIAGLKASAEPTPGIAWLSLDAADNDPVLFWTYTIAALQTRLDGIGKQAMSLLQMTKPPDLEGTLSALVNELAQAPGSLVLVLDDYHFISNNTVHRSLSFLVSRLPPQLTIMIVSRTDPPLPLALLRGRGQLLEIRLADLRFSNEEAAAYLNEAMQLALPEAAVETLNSKTEGWPAGLQMAALSLQGRQDAARFIQNFSGSNRYILEYLVGEVLSCQAEEIQEFMLQTSVLDDLCGELCDAVSPTPAGGQAALEYLERANLFLLPLDQEQHWYRYHHLFADLLRARLQLAYPERIRELHSRAVGWFEANGMVPEAVQHARATGDTDRLAALVEENAVTLLVRDDISTLTKWMSYLSENSRQSRPLLSLYHAWALTMTGTDRPGRTGAGCHRAGSPAGLDSPETRSLRNSINMNRAYLHLLRGDIALAQSLIRGLGSEFPAASPMLQGGVMLAMGFCNFNFGDIPASIQNYSDVIRLGQAAGDTHSTLRGIFEKAGMLKLQGRLNEIESLYHQAEELASSDQGDPSLGLGIVHMGLGDFLKRKK